MRQVLMGLSLAAVVLGGAARAADHSDGPAVTADPSTDINDVYAWMSGDGKTVNLAMTVNPGATAMTKFSNAALYVFHINSSRTYPDAAPTAFTVICQFDMEQKVSCWGPQGEYVTGVANQTAGIASASRKMQVFAGVRADAFYFNIAGFRTAMDAASRGIMKDPGGCPKGLEGLAPQFTAILATDGRNMPGKDGFAKGGDAVPGASYSGNVLALVVTLDKTLVTDATHPLLGVWASTNKAK